MAGERGDRWVVCSGAVEFVAIASALALAACAPCVVWESDAARARDDVEYGPLGAQTHVVVGEGCVGGDPFEVACDLASLHRGRTVLCLAGAAARSQAAASRGVTATVDPAGLTRLLCSIRAEELALGLKARAARTAPPAGRQVRGVGVVPVGDAGPARSGGFDLEALKEPVVLAPVVGLSQDIECKVAGMDTPVPTIALASARGGVGKSAIAVVAAVSLARSGLSVCLIDLDFQFGTCLGYLGSGETDGLIDASRPPSKAVTVDARTLARCRTTPRANLAAYEFCRLPEQAELLGSVAGELVRAARAGCDVAVVDLPSGVNETVAQVLELADRCLFVADQGALSLESVSAQQALCGRLGIPRTKLVTVMNRCDPRHRDEGFLSRVGFETSTPQIAHVLDGGAEVTQMLSIGGADDMVAMQNKFTASVQAMLAGICADLGIAGYAPPPAPGARRAFDKAARLGAKRPAGREEDQAACPF